MYCKTPVLKGEFFQVGDKEVSEGAGKKIITLAGWWSRRDGSDGGDLIVAQSEGDTHWFVEGFDGATDLPGYIRDDLLKQDVKVNF